MLEVAEPDLSPITRAAAAERPAGPPAGHQRWTNLLFIHWRLPPEAVRQFLPAALTLDTWEGDAWIGLVAFYMSRVRARWLPPVPGLSWFCETNVRTYVHFRGRDPGVWFFSLDASNSTAVRFARRFWHLPYFRADMSLERRGATVACDSRRLWPGTGSPGYTIEAEVGPLLGAGLGDRPLPPGPAAAGTLESFLAERYILYVQDSAGQLHAGRVHHPPYPLRDARVVSLDESLMSAAGFSRPDHPAHVAFSDGVSVEIFPLRPVEE